MAVPHLIKASNRLLPATRLKPPSVGPTTMGSSKPRDRIDAISPSEEPDPLLSTCLEALTFLTSSSSTVRAVACVLTLITPEERWGERNRGEAAVCDALEMIAGKILGVGRVCLIFIARA